MADDDGVLNVPFPVEEDEESTMPGQNSQNEDVLAQSQVDHHARLRLIAERGHDSSNFVKARAEEHFLHTTQLVGALAAARLEKNAIADAVLQNRAAGGQPQASSAGAGVSGGT